ncbi:MAG TPA: AraC family transcriptional regulator [Pyrinomonadaceae bacterium]|jgi:AraC family transcriptional regulator|nr:AraC family transcriptional regulator [Pyrinomonadaceae bacterium]
MLNRFFVSPDFSVYFRRAKQLAWQNQATSGYSLLTTLKGRLDYTVDEQHETLASSESVLLEPNTTVTTRGRQVELLFLTFSASLVIQHATAMRLIPPKSIVTFSREPISDDQNLKRILADFVSELTAEKPGKEIVLRALVEQTLVHILRNYATPKLSEELELSRVGLVDRRIRRSVELMHTQLDQDLTLKALAAASYLSPFHFARLFKKLTGSSPHNYLAGIRATRAQLLLAETDLSVTEIGARVGYLSGSHFTKAFRIATGATPREFRQGLVSRNNDGAMRRQ